MAVLTAARRHRDYTAENRARGERRAKVRAAKAAPPDCYYCGQPVVKVDCWPPVCRNCDHLPALERLL